MFLESGTQGSTFCWLILPLLKTVYLRLVANQLPKKLWWAWTILITHINSVVDGPNTYIANSDTVAWAIYGDDGFILLAVQLICFVYWGWIHCRFESYKKVVLGLLSSNLATLVFLSKTVLTTCHLIGLLTPNMISSQKDQLSSTLVFS